ncbi:phosphopantetheine-binding protein [Streptomyces flaveolus]|uniref:acyl carrier protein n=1 Tax=Streptomyces flaveolus TaxID=67297 RepID=UPI003421D200
MSAFYERLIVLLTTKLGVSHEDVSPDATFEDLDMDSLALVELTDILDAEFGISIEEGAVGKQTTLADVAKVLETYLVDPR